MYKLQENSGDSSFHFVSGSKQEGKYCTWRHKCKLNYICTSSFFVCFLTTIPYILKELGQSIRDNSEVALMMLPSGLPVCFDCHTLFLDGQSERWQYICRGSEAQMQPVYRQETISTAPYSLSSYMQRKEIFRVLNHCNDSIGHYILVICWYSGKNVFGAACFTIQHLVQ